MPDLSISTDLRNFVVAFLLVFASLLPIVNPMGSAPIFLAMTAGSSDLARRKLATQIAINAFILLMGSLIFGAFVLRMFGLSVPVVQVAGGAVLCALGWNMLSNDGPVAAETAALPDDKALLRAFYPLTLPLTVDPGAISVAITLGANHVHGVERVVVGFVAAILAVGLIALIVWLAYRYARHVGAWLGHSRMMVILRLSAFIMLCIGVEITWNGVKALVSELPITGAPVAAVAAPNASPPTAPK
ncbi:MAG: MarC family protein [Betaproteobacteria bacterium]